MELKLIRVTETKNQTKGILTVVGTTKVYATLELKWRNNEKKWSCIPKGQYEIEKRWSKRHKDHFKVNNVKDRSMILIHAGNTYLDTLGCILVGKGWSNLNGDADADVTRSREAMMELLTILDNKTKLTII